MAKTAVLRALPITLPSRVEFLVALARMTRKIGEPPVIYSEELTERSMQQLEHAMDNKGYFQAEIDTTKVVKEKKLDLTYHVTANDPYHIRNYTNQ